MKRFVAAWAAAVAAVVVVGAQKLPAPAPLGAIQWQIDPNHSSANFSVRHLMVSTVRGQLGPITGRIDFDGKDVRTITADVTVDVTGISTQNPKRDEDLRGDNFFNTPKFPSIRFKSKRVEAGAGGAFKLVGDLTIRDTTKEVALDVEAPSPVTKGMQGFVTGTSATTKIKRLEYGLKYNAMVEAGPVVGDEVTITLDVEAGRPTPPGGGK